MTKKRSLNRRKFIKNATVVSAAGAFGAKDFLNFFSGGVDNSGNKIHPFPNNEVASSPKDTFWIIPHTHWEGAVYVQPGPRFDVWCYD